MSLLSSVAIYFVLWWLSLFVVLPFGVKNRSEAGGETGGETVPGSDPGAPVAPLLLKKALATTVLAAVIFAGIYVYFGVFGLTIEDMLE